MTAIDPNLGRGSEQVNERVTTAVDRDTRAYPTPNILTLHSPTPNDAPTEHLRVEANGTAVFHAARDLPFTGMGLPMLGRTLSIHASSERNDIHVHP